MRHARVRVPAWRLRRVLLAVARSKAPVERRSYCATWARAVKPRMAPVDVFSVAAALLAAADGFGSPRLLRWRLRRLGTRLEARA